MREFWNTGSLDFRKSGRIEGILDFRNSGSRDSKTECRQKA